MQELVEKNMCPEKKIFLPKKCEVCGGPRRATHECSNGERWHVRRHREVVVVTGLPTKPRWTKENIFRTKEKLAAILGPLAFPPIGRSLHIDIEPRKPGTAYLAFGDAETAGSFAFFALPS